MIAAATLHLDARSRTAHRGQPGMPRFQTKVSIQMPAWSNKKFYILYFPAIAV
jgi:hypothetical protein